MNFILTAIELTALGLTAVGAAAGDPRANLIAALFGSGEQGALYDPSDAARPLRKTAGGLWYLPWVGEYSDGCNISHSKMDNSIKRLLSRSWTECMCIY